MKRKYISMQVSSMVLNPEGAVLTGSLTATKIDVNEVTVEDYHNGLPDSSPFETISFD